MGNDQSMVRHEPSSSSVSANSAFAKPARSAMRRSRSVRDEGSSMDSSQDPMRYIPKMTLAEKGLIMPTRPHGNDLSGNGIESPQWGWYINTTPPTPEMYYAGQSSRSARKTDSHHLSSGTQPGQTTDAKPQHNQVFQSLQNKNAPMGWTSVPI